MQSSKIFQLIKSLNDKEKSTFKKTLSNNKRKSLILLFKICLKHSVKEENVSPKEFYELFYKEKYSKKKDYLFRNELRLLNNLIFDFIIEKEAKTKIKKEEYFSKELFLKHLITRKKCLNLLVFH